jgi:hypothetical protein
MNGDGRADLIVGDREGYVNYYTRNADGTLHAQPDMIAGGSTIVANYNSSPVIVDWNGDGLLDMVLGSQGTYPNGDPLRLYLNSGTAGSYLFASYSTIFCADTDILHYRCMPTVADLNLDGKKDLLLGEDNAYLYYLENDGTNNAPHFSTSVQIQTVSGPLHEYYGLRLCVNNWNESGYPDLITSDYDGYVRIYLATATGIEDSQSPVPQGNGLRVMGSPTTGAFGLLLSIDSPAEVTVSAFSQDGRLVQRTSLGDLTAGDHNLQFDLSGNTPGVYLVVCTAGQSVMHSRVVLTE